MTSGIRIAEIEGLVALCVCENRLSFRFLQGGSPVPMSRYKWWVAYNHYKEWIYRCVFFTSQVAVWDFFHQKHVLVIQLFCLIGSVYGLFTITYICMIFMANVGKIIPLPWILWVLKPKRKVCTQIEVWHSNTYCRPGWTEEVDVHNINTFWDMNQMVGHKLILSFSFLVKWSLISSILTMTSWDFELKHIGMSNL